MANTLLGGGCLTLILLTMAFGLFAAGRGAEPLPDSVNTAFAVVYVSGLGAIVGGVIVHIARR